MKNLCLTLLLAICCLVTGRADSDNSVPPDDIKVTITIEIGRRPDCTWAFSICGITIGSAGLTATGELFPSGSGSGGGGGGTWKLSIPRDNFAKAYPGFLARLDGKSSVTFEDSYTVPSDVKKALGAMNDLVVQANVPYPLKYENGQYVITFPL